MNYLIVLHAIVAESSVRFNIDLFIKVYMEVTRMIAHD